MQQSTSLFLPRTGVHLKDLADYLAGNSERLGVVPNTLTKAETKIAFQIKKDVVMFNCTYYLPGLFVAETDATSVDSMAFAKGFFAEIAVIWPGIKVSLNDGSLVFGISEVSAGGVQEAMVAACLDFVEKAVAMIRETPQGWKRLRQQFFLATETRQRILQSLTSLKVFDSAISPINPKLMTVGTGQIDFASRFVDTRISRLGFEIQDRIDHKLTRFNWLLVFLTIMLIVFTALAVLKV